MISCLSLGSTVLKSSIDICIVIWPCRYGCFRNVTMLVPVLDTQPYQLGCSHCVVAVLLEVDHISIIKQEHTAQLLLQKNAFFIRIVLHFFIKIRAKSYILLVMIIFDQPQNEFYPHHRELFICYSSFFLSVCFGVYNLILSCHSDWPIMNITVCPKFTLSMGAFLDECEIYQCDGYMEKFIWRVRLEEVWIQGLSLFKMRR